MTSIGSYTNKVKRITVQCDRLEHNGKIFERISRGVQVAWFEMVRGKWSPIASAEMEKLWQAINLPGLQVLLSNCGNPDYRQDPDQPVYGAPEPKWVPIATIAEASKLCRAYIEKHDLGGGNWSGGEVRQDGKVIAHVSYNGSIWEGTARSWKPGTKEILP